MLFALSWRLGPILACVIISTGAVAALYKQQTKIIENDAAKANSAMVGVASQTFSAITTVRYDAGKLVVVVSQCIDLVCVTIWIVLASDATETPVMVCVTDCCPRHAHQAQSSGASQFMLLVDPSAQHVCCTAWLTKKPPAQRSL